MGSITTDYINSSRRQLVAAVLNPNLKILLSNIEAAQDVGEEKLLLESTRRCNPQHLSLYRDNLPKLSAEKLSKNIHTKFSNVEMMENVECLTNSIWYVSSYDAGSLTQNQRIRRYLNNLQQIGEGMGVEGYALNSYFKNADNMYIIKTSRFPANDKVIRHEIIVGLYATNYLRKYIPNFAYVYGGFRCSRPIIDPSTKKVVQWCGDNDPDLAHYIILENITPSITYRQYIQTATTTDFLQVYMQVLLALRTANELYGFTHYDLHFENILIRTIPEQPDNFLIEYPYANKIEYFIAKNIATIIDYGTSHIEINGKHYGRNGQYRTGIYSDREWVIGDAYKLLLFTAMEAYNSHNNMVLDECRKMFQYFNLQEDMITAIEKQFPARFIIPLNEETIKVININEYIAYIKSVCDCSFILEKKNELAVLKCDTLCMTNEIFFREVGISTEITASSIIDFYDLFVTLTNREDRENLRYLMDNFNYSVAMNNHVREIDNLNKNILEKIRNINLVNIYNASLSEILDINTLHLLIKMYTDLAEIKSLFNDLKLMIHVGKEVAMLYKDMSTSLYKEISGTFKTISSNTGNVVDTLWLDGTNQYNINESYLNYLFGDENNSSAGIYTPDLKRKIQENPRFSWYIVDRFFFRHILQYTAESISDIPQRYPTAEMSTEESLTKTASPTPMSMATSMTPMKFSLSPERMLF